VISHAHGVHMKALEDPNLQTHKIKPFASLPFSTAARAPQHVSDTPAESATKTRG
jgi:hypothetical protein